MKPCSQCLDSGTNWDSSISQIKYAKTVTMTFLSGHTKHLSQEQIGSILSRLELWDGCKDTSQKALSFLYWLRIARSGPVHGMSLLPSLRCTGWQIRWRETSTKLFILLFVSLQFMGLNSEIQYQFNIVGHHKSPPITVSHSLILSLPKEFSLVWYIKQSLKTTSNESERILSATGWRCGQNEQGGRSHVTTTKHRSAFSTSWSPQDEWLGHTFPPSAGSSWDFYILIHRQREGGGEG